MAFLGNILSIAENVKVPGGLWEWLILGVFDFVTNYGWRILLFTVFLKLLLVPLDLFQRVKMRKNQKITKRLEPEIEKLKKQYGHDKQLFAQKQMELNRKEGFSYFSSCLPMIATLAIFISLFWGLTSISQYKNMLQYIHMYDTYTAVYNETLLDKNDGWVLREGDGGVVWVELVNDGTKTQDELDSQELAQKKEASDLAQNAVVEAYYNDYQEGFLWIKNIWSPDVFWKQPILEHSDFKSAVGKYGENAEHLGISDKQLEDLMGDKYDIITKKLREDERNKTNGFLILPILSVAFSFLSQFLMTRLQKKSGQDLSAAGGMMGSMKMMMFVMPFVMGIFAIGYTSAFTIYIVANSFMTIIISTSATLFMRYLDIRDKKLALADSGVERYGRPDPNDIDFSKSGKKSGKK